MLESSRQNDHKNCTKGSDNNIYEQEKSNKNAVTDTFTARRKNNNIFEDDILNVNF